MKYDQKILSPHDQCLFAQHADFSHDLLDGRIPLSKNYLNIIKYHHFLNDRMKEVISKEKVNNSNQDMVFGLEIVLVSVFDMLVAMTNPRPYRRPMSLYQSLEIIKRMIADDYPQEFKALVIFLKQFFRQ
jgi:HD-GYP domain-containing protein (c-di-GMP phosphodiesterase class II)